MTENNPIRDNLFRDAVNKIRENDDTYPVDAYFFVRNALDAVISVLDKPKEGKGRHVTGQELLGGMRVFALQEFGPLALTVLNSWNIYETEDFGNLVFNLVENGILGSTADDSREDFAYGYDFYEAFRVPFLPGSARCADEDNIC